VIGSWSSESIRSDWTRSSGRLGRDGSALAGLQESSASAAPSGGGVDGEVDCLLGDRVDPLGRYVEQFAAEEAGIDGQAHDLPVLVQVDMLDLAQARAVAGDDGCPAIDAHGVRGRFVTTWTGAGVGAVELGSVPPLGS